MWALIKCGLPESTTVTNPIPASSPTVLPTWASAVPGAVAAKLIYPEKKVLAISGDGGFMMNSQEYETALREGTPIVTLIFSDASYGLSKWKQMDHFGHNCFVDFQNPDFVK